MVAKSVSADSTLVSGSLSVPVILLYQEIQSMFLFELLYTLVCLHETDI